MSYNNVVKRHQTEEIIFTDDEDHMFKERVGIIWGSYLTDWDPNTVWSWEVGTDLLLALAATLVQVIVLENKNSKISEEAIPLMATMDNRAVLSGSCRFESHSFLALRHTLALEENANRRQFLRKID